MVILIDTNVLLDFLLHREQGYRSAKKVVDYCVENPEKGYIAFHTVPTIFYVLRKYVDLPKRREMLKDICSVVTVIGTSHGKVMEAIDRQDFSDFEDCLQMYCAKDVGADYIVTNNITDYMQSDVPAITSEQAAGMLETKS